MNPELIEQAYGLHGQYHHLQKANQRQPQPENKCHEAAGPGLPQCGPQVVALRGMMAYMASPEETTLVACAMEPVITEIIGDKEQQPGPPLITDFEDRKSMDGSKCRERHSLSRYPDEDIANPHCQTGRGVLDL